MAVHVVTLMWGNARERYGETFLRSFAAFWPADVGLYAVTDKREEPMPRGKHIWLGIDGRLDRFNAKQAPPRSVPDGDAWKYAAAKWAPQGLAPHIVSRRLRDGAILCWLDADVETLRPVPENFVQDLLGDADVVHLGRPGKWSEIGFWACRLNDGTRRWLLDMAETWATGEVYRMDQWHSAWVFDRCLERSALRVRNLTPAGRGHVWFQSPLGQYMDHMKGKRKERGGSAEAAALRGEDGAGRVEPIVR